MASIRRLEFCSEWGTLIFEVLSVHFWAAIFIYLISFVGIKIGIELIRVYFVPVVVWWFRNNRITLFLFTFVAWRKFIDSLAHTSWIYMWVWLVEFTWPSFTIKFIYISSITKRLRHLISCINYSSIFTRKTHSKFRKWAGPRWLEQCFCDRYLIMACFCNCTISTSSLVLKISWSSFLKRVGPLLLTDSIL